MKYSYGFLLAFLGLILFMGFYNIGYKLTNAYAQKPLVFSVQENPYNKTFAEWAAWWWNHHLSVPDIKENASLAHPRDKYSPEKCSWTQDNGPVWWLPDGTDRADVTQPEIRECTIPQGKALLVQIVGSGCSKGEGFKDEQELTNCAVWVLPTAGFSAKIDGVEVMNTNKDANDRQRFYVEPFRTNLTYVQNSYYREVKPGTYDGMVAGYYLFVQPLPPGSHEIQFDETAIEFLGGFPKDQRLTNVKYLITVK